MSHQITLLESEKRKSSLSATTEMLTRPQKTKFTSRHLKYLLVVLPVYLITLGIAASQNTLNPFSKTVTGGAHYGYKFMTMILFGWVFMGIVRLFLYFLPVFVIFVLALFKLPTEMLKNYVEHIRSIGIPFARFLMFVVFAVYYNEFFVINANTDKNDVDDDMVYNILKILAVLSALLFAESLYIRKVGVNFHEMAFKDRIKSNKIALKTIDKLDKAVNTTFEFSVDLTSDTQAHFQAKRLFESLSRGKDAVVVQDFYPFFSSPEDAQEAFKIFDRNNDGDIIKSEMKGIIHQIYEERRALTNSLDDITHAIAKLDKILVAVCFAVTFFAALAIFSTDPVKTIVPFSSFLVGLSFIFGQSARDVFSAILFVFVTHPFDTNDRVYIKNENLVVKELGLLTTTFVRVDGQECYWPNSELSKQNIYNIRRSQSQNEIIKVAVAFDTPCDKILQLNHELNVFLTEHSREYDPSITVNVIELESMSKLTLTMCLTYKRNWVDGALRMRLKTKFNLKLKEVLLNLGFVYFEAPQQVHVMKE